MSTPCHAELGAAIEAWATKRESLLTTPPCPLRDAMVTALTGAIDDAWAAIGAETRSYGDDT